MKITPVATPIQNAQTSVSSSAQDARARAIARLSEQPVQNASQIAPEEMGAITANVQQPEEQQLMDTSTGEGAEETTPVAEVPKTAEQIRESERFARLARGEKALRAKQLQLEASYKAKEDALKAREQALETQPKFDQTQYISKDRLLKAPLEVMAETGLSYEQLTEQLINQTPRDPRMDHELNQLKAEIKALKDAREDSQKAAQESQTQQYQAALSQIRSDVKALVNADDTFEAVKATNSYNDVVELIEKVYQKESRLMTVEEATQQVEDFLIEEALKLTKIKKVEKRWQAARTPASTQTPTATSQAQKQPQPMKTLTNANASARKLSSRERALLAFKGELKT